MNIKIYHSVYELEKLVSNRSVADSETSSMHEAETTFIIPKGLFGDQSVPIVEMKIGNQNAYGEEGQNNLDNMKCFRKEEQCNDPLPNQKKLTEGLIWEVKDTLDEHPHGSSEELKEIITISQGNIHDGQDFLLTDVSIVNLEESLQSSLTDKVSKTQGKTSPKVSNDKKVERIVILNNDLQKFGKKNMTELRNIIQNLQQEFNHLCSLISDLVIFYILKSVPNLLNQM